MARKKTVAAAAAADRGPSFEEALGRLEEIVRELEETDLPLEKSLAVFEEGVRLSRLLHERLNEAEKKIEILLKDGAGGKAPAPFKAAGDEEAGTAAGGTAADDDEDEDEDEDEDGDGGAGQTGFRF